MKHFFDVEIANEYGVHAAIMIEHFAFGLSTTRQMRTIFTTASIGHTIAGKPLKSCFRT